MADIYKKSYTLAPGERERVSFGKLASTQLAAHPGRTLFEADDLNVSQQAAQHFALILHELVTNAMKNGALSVPEGRVVVAGRIDSATRKFVFTWRESGGPPVATPMNGGFGILRQMAGQFAERVIMDFPPEGLFYALHVDLAAIEAPGKGLWPKVASRST